MSPRTSAALARPGLGRRPAVPKAQAKLRVVGPKSRSRNAHVRRARLTVVGSAAAIVLCLFGVVVSHVVITQNQFELERLQQETTNTEAHYNDLRVEVAELESPDRIVQEAQTRLGMVMPGAIKYLAPSTNEKAAPQQSRGEEAVGPDNSWASVKQRLAAQP